MELDKLRQMTTEELKEAVEEAQKSLTQMKMAHVISPMENPNKLKDTKKNVARMLTILRERQINQAADGSN